MTGQLKRSLLVAVALGMAVGAPSAYLLTLGHCFLPLRAFDYRDERIEVREYEGLGWYLVPSLTIIHRVQNALHPIIYPGRARMDAAIAKVESTWGPSFFESSGPNSEFQQVLQTMGYSFPPGCSAGVDTNGWRIVHYPSMLNRIERDLRLNRRRKPTPPNHAAAGNGAATLLFPAERQARPVPEPRR